MKQYFRFSYLGCALLLLCVACLETPDASLRMESVGIFEGQTTPLAFRYDSLTQVYELTDKTAPGTHFLWKRLEGDFLLDLRLPQDSTATFGLQLRPAPEADRALGTLLVENGRLDFIPAAQTSLSTRGGMATRPEYLRFERRGRDLLVYYAPVGQPFRLVATQRMSNDSVLYGGIVAEVAEKPLTFSNVRMSTPVSEAVFQDSTSKVISRLEILEVESGLRQIVLEKKGRFEAPNWYNDGSFFIINGGGLLYKVSVDGTQVDTLDTAFLTRCNNDHGISPDGKTLVISNNDSVGSRIYTMPMSGGTPRLITPQAPSYWHGWSPDGDTLAYVARRQSLDFNIYTIALDSLAEEQAITRGGGLDDGPDYAPDSTHIFFNSERSGTMQIWRMRTDGSELVQLTTDDFNDWFPHPSPDGTKLVFLSYLPEVASDAHPPAKKVMLRMLDLTKENPEPVVLTHLFGGQGTINVPSWSPESSHVAFMSYSFQN